MTLHPDWLTPGWGLADIGALMTTRAGGASRHPFDSMNLRDGIGDDPAAVAANQRLFETAIGATPVWLQQVHGTRVLRLSSAPGAAVPVAGSAEPADASVTTVPGLACTVQVADCLPVLFAAAGARAVGAAHAGWRGLAAGVLEATLAAVCEAAQCPPGAVSAWLGPCIGPRHFEVGEDVLHAFGGLPAPNLPPEPAGSPDPPRAFQPAGPGKWLADLPLLARRRLRAAGIGEVSGGSWCTFADRSRFFSFRRDRLTGRMAAAVWIEPRR